MRPAKPGAPLSTLLLLVLVLPLPGAHGRPRSGRGAYAAEQEPKSWLFLPAARAGRAPSASRSAGKQSFALMQGFKKAELSRAENRPSLKITGFQEKRNIPKRFEFKRQIHKTFHRASHIFS
ncbi:ALK and LTK ligand 1 isoform X2 [Mustela lutreola]|uniref:ALK and LTK ligand 1 isoform X2 n=1 Tax=Mustela putorius furo TaxID=9669 RepID=A0A8U0RVP5_MUSPF|nr:ALK and LTK ligand 1 isoform X2 [Mustela putorius furo]XP_059024910.1 ALK and LTK ligand 1 isoform X2 [Mustela lutreola]